jgi:hypothetical protein
MPNLLNLTHTTPAKHQTFPCPLSFPWDKTRDKTPFVPAPRMAESLPFFGASREPRDGFELSVPRGTTKVSRQKLNLGVKAVRNESHRWPSACDLKERRQNKDEGKSALAPQNGSVCSRVFRGKSRRSHGPALRNCIVHPNFCPHRCPSVYRRHLRRLGARRVRLRWRLDRDRRRTRRISKAILATPAECIDRRARDLPRQTTVLSVGVGSTPRILVRRSGRLVARLAGRTAPGLQVDQLDAVRVDHDLAGPTALPVRRAV